MNEWLNGWMDGWMDGQMDRLMDVCTFIYYVYVRTCIHVYTVYVCVFVMDGGWMDG